MDEWLKKCYNLFKNNWTIIALFPTIVGGLWQIIQLAQISVNMIRFFSISQLLSDGIIILLFFIFMILIISPIIFKIIFSNKSNDHKNKPFPFYILITYILLIIVLYAFSSFNWSQYITINRPISLLMVYVFTSCFIYFLYSLNIKWVEKNILIINTIYVITYFIINTLVTLIALDSITKNFKGIDNFNMLISKIEKKDNYSKKPAILYFNDKYIFIELERKNKKSVLIKKIDDLFEN